MGLVVNDILEKITDSHFVGEKFRIVRLKNISGNVHAYIVNIKDEKNRIYGSSICFRRREEI